MEEHSLWSRTVSVRENEEEVISQIKYTCYAMLYNLFLCSGLFGLVLSVLSLRARL